jgi:hypothetical protein
MPTQSHEETIFTHMLGSLAVKLDRSVAGLYQFVSVIMTYKLASMKTKWQPEYEYATSSFSSSHTFWPDLPESSAFKFNKN